MSLRKIFSSKINVKQNSQGRANRTDQKDKAL